MKISGIKSAARRNRNPGASLKKRVQNLFLRLALLAGVYQAAAQPIVTFTQPTNGQIIVTFTNLAGTAQAATGTVRQVTFSIYDQSTGQWWNGTNYQWGAVSLAGQSLGN